MSIFDDAAVSSAADAFGLGAQSGLGLASTGTASQQHLAEQYRMMQARAMIGAQKPMKERNFNPNEREAYAMPLSQLVTLWNAKFGDKWVHEVEDGFWGDAYDRMVALNLFERSGGWFRIKEDA